MYLGFAATVRLKPDTTYGLHSGFKWYNDALGHAVGDRIIERVAYLLRLGLGDEGHEGGMGWATGIEPATS